MKTCFWSIKLMAATALLMASAALAGPDAQKAAKQTPGQSEPKDQPVAELPSGQRSIELDERADSRFEFEESLLDGPRKGPIARMMRSSIKPPEYWIGVSCRRLPAGLHEHLEISDDRGVLVVEVVSGAPAAKAGLVENDILLSADDEPLRSVADVSQAVTKAKDKPVTFELIRKGRRKTVEITPEKNPHWKPEKDRAASKPPYAELDRIYRWFERHHPGHSIRPRMRLRFMHPGMILPPDAPMHPALPGGMSITIMKRGDDPTQITVTRDDDVWKVDENHLDELPEDIRPHVERMLRGLVIGPEMSGPRLDYVPEWIGPRKRKQDLMEPPSLRDRIEERMERMNRRLEELHEMIEGLRDQKGPEEKK